MSKKLWLKRVVVFGSAFALAWVLAGAASAQPPISMKEGKFDSAEGKGAMKAFRMKEGFKGREHAEQVAKKLFTKSRHQEAVSFKEDDDNLLHVGKKDPSMHFRINKKTGDLSFHKGMRGYDSDGPTPGLPQGEKAVEKAKMHLRELGLLPDGESQMFVQHVGGLRMVEWQKDGTTQELDKLVTVHFGRKIDGIEVGGPGSKIVVSLGADGELVALTRRWVELRQERKSAADFRGKSDVRANVKGLLRREAAKARKVAANAPDFGYFDDGKGNVEPAYFFNADLTYDTVEAKVEKGHTDKFYGAVPALKRSQADFRQVGKAPSPPRLAKKPDKDVEPTGDDQDS